MDDNVVDMIGGFDVNTNYLELKPETSVRIFNKLAEVFSEPEFTEKIVYHRP